VGQFPIGKKENLLFSLQILAGFELTAFGAEANGKYNKPLLS
jgi:hypothetical protein